MSLVATLICNPNSPALDSDRDRGRARGAAAAQSRRSGCRRHRRRHHLRQRRRRRSTSPTGCAPRAAICRSTSWCSLLATRRKKLFLADMDSTMIGQECIDELADFVGLKEPRRRDHRTRDARRDRVRAGAARARRAAQGPAARRDRRGARHPDHADAGRPRAGADDARQRRLHLPRLRRLHPVHPVGRGAARLRRAPRQRTAESKTAS